jgi:hypothetical protein
MTNVRNHHVRVQIVGVLLLGGCALGACSGDDKAAVGQSNLGSDASSDATMADDSDDAPAMVVTTVPPDGEAVADAVADASVDVDVADGTSAADAAPDSDGPFDSGDGGDEHDASHTDAGDGGGAAVDAGDGGHDGGVVSEGGADAGDGGAVRDAGDGGNVDAGDGGAGDAGDGGLSMTAKIILDTQGADCEACALASCLGPAASCEAFSGQVADGGAMSGTSMAVLCDQTLACILDSTPTVPCYDQGSALSCYCGVENQTVCRNSGPTATAQCASQEQNGFETQDPPTILGRIENTAYPSGMANALLDCIGSNCASCLQ